jgi:methyltransferase (TIGR00027 family)
MIAIETASRTARITAAYRARATERPSPVCHDEWAQHLADEDAWRLVKLGDAAAPDMELGVALRTTWLDEHVRSWDGDQVVVLGAGFDTRAARLARAGLRFFEVDHPATQARKKATLDRVTGYPADTATLVPCNFETDDFVERLCSSGWRPDRSCLVLWEGVLPYLTEAAVRSTLRRLATVLEGRSSMLVDHLGPADLEPGRIDAAARVVCSLGEPFLFLTHDLRTVALEEGFRTVDVASMGDLCRSTLGDSAPVTPLYRRWYLVEARTTAR